MRFRIPEKAKGGAEAPPLGQRLRSALSMGPCLHCALAAKFSGMPLDSALHASVEGKHLGACFPAEAIAPQAGPPASVQSLKVAPLERAGAATDGRLAGRLAVLIAPALSATP